MCTTRFNLITYNTHLFPGEPLNIGPLHEDGPRKTAIDQTYLEQIQPFAKSGAMQLAALQEVWDAKLAGDIAEDVDSHHHGSFNCRYAENRKGGLNPSGLLLLGDPACTFAHESATTYKSPTECGLTGWSGQDDPVFKGFLQVTCSFPCPSNPGTLHSIGLFDTHMPVAYGSHPVVACAFDTLAKAIKDFRGNTTNASCPVFLLGDLNIDVYKTSTMPSTGLTEYADAVTGRLMKGTGLHDAAAEQAAQGKDPGGTIRPATNTLWQYFNSSKPPFPDPQRIDYFFYADSPDGTVTVAVESVQVKTDGLTIHDGSLNCSDHYPLEITATVTVQH